jgi:GTPase
LEYRRKSFPEERNIVKSGFVAIVGRPNSGKSTLLNRLIGTKVSIVSDKPQTTRNRILGIYTSETAQIGFVDTPGIHRPGYKMNIRMMELVREAMKEVDMLLHMVDVNDDYGKGEQFALDMVEKYRKPCILLLNKVDLVNKGRLLPIIERYAENGDYKEIIPVSAKQGDNIEILIERICTFLPEGELIYPDDYFTDQQEGFMVSEAIREKVLHKTRQELPYSTAIKIEEFDESRRAEGLVVITASIIVDKTGQKKIIIGRGGQMIKQIGTDARKDIEKILDVRKVYLELNVKVIPGWRDHDFALKDIGVN